MILSADFYVNLTNFDCSFSIYLIWAYWIWASNNSFYLIWRWGSRRVWPVSSGCLLLHGTWSYLRICRGPYCPTLDFVFAFWIMITFDTLLISLFCIYYLEYFRYDITYISHATTVTKIHHPYNIYHQSYVTPHYLLYNTT
jgi:hypothetical protein